MAEVEYQGEVLEIFTQDLLERANPVDTRGAGFDEPPCLPNPACDERTAVLKAEVDSAHEEFESARAALHESFKIVPDIGINSPDGGILWRKSTTRYNHGVKAYDEALRRLSEHLLDR